MPLPDQRLPVRGESVKRMTGLVQQRVHIVHQPHRVHEDERPATEV